MMTLKQWVTYWRVYWQQYYLQLQARKKAEQKKRQLHKFRKVVHPLKVEVVKPVLWRVPLGRVKSAHPLVGMVHALFVEPKKPKQ